MAKKLIIDCDPGIDDAVALCLALFDPRLEVLAVTAVEGNISAEQASLNVQVLVDHLDPPRYPRLGTASRAEAAPVLDPPRRRSSATKCGPRPGRSRSSAWAP